MEMRVFDGKFNETRDQAISDFEAKYGFSPIKEAQKEQAYSPETIREQIKN
jgi:hypothetical protein